MRNIMLCICDQYSDGKVCKKKPDRRLSGLELRQIMSVEKKFGSKQFLLMESLIGNKNERKYRNFFIDYIYVKHIPCK